MCLMCSRAYVEVTLREGERIGVKDGEIKSLKELSVPVCMVILGPVSNNYTALNGKATQEGG